MSGSVDAIGSTRNDHPPQIGQAGSQLGSHVVPVRSRRPGTNDGHRSISGQRQRSARPQGIGSSTAACETVQGACRPIRVARADQPGSNSRGPLVFDVQICPADPHRLPTVADRWMAAAQCLNSLDRTERPHQRREATIAGLACVEQRLSSPPLISIHAAPLMVPSRKPRAADTSCSPGTGRSARSARVHATRMIRSIPRALSVDPLIRRRRRSSGGNGK